MRLKSLCLAGAVAASLAAPAAALADPYWDHDGWRARHWREHQWREHERWEHRRAAWYGDRRCWVENRGHYDGWGHYVYRPVRVCYR